IWPPGLELLEKVQGQPEPAVWVQREILAKPMQPPLAVPAEAVPGAQRQVPPGATARPKQRRWPPRGEPVRAAPHERAVGRALRAPRQSRAFRRPEPPSGSPRPAKIRCQRRTHPAPARAEEELWASSG